MTMVVKNSYLFTGLSNPFHILETEDGRYFNTATNAFVSKATFEYFKAAEERKKKIKAVTAEKNEAILNAVKKVENKK
jgi:hypothetical protein